VISEEKTDCYEQNNNEIRRWLWIVGIGCGLSFEWDRLIGYVRK
jgi:hypothetical protein